jgi:Transposase DDE domain
MTRAATTSVPACPSPAQPHLARSVRRWLCGELHRFWPALDASIARTRANRYCKKYDATAQTLFLLFHGLSRSPSLSQSYESFPACPELLAASGLALPTPPDAADPVPSLRVARATVFRANTARRPTFLAGLLPALCQRVRQLGQPVALDCPPDLLAWDSTVIRLSLKLAPWLPKRRTKRNASVRIQLAFLVRLALPVHLLLTDTRKNDCTGLDAALLDDPAQREALAGLTLIIDLGYYSHTRLAALTEAGIHVVTRAHPQATVTVVHQHAVQAPLWQGAGSRIQVIADETVDIGSSANRAGTVLPGWRRVTATVAPTAVAARQGRGPLTYTVLTDRWDLTAIEVVQTYLWRWQIELFFRWLKSHLHLCQVLGYSYNAVLLSIWLTCLVHLLCLLAAAALGRQRTSPQLLAVLAAVFRSLTALELRPPTSLGEQLPLPGLVAAIGPAP